MYIPKGKESFYNNGRIILDSLDPLERDVRGALTSTVSMKTKLRKEKKRGSYYGYGADELNKVLRSQFSTIPYIKGETHVKNGAFFSVSKEGFDFTIYDSDYNYSRIYNYYVGFKGIFDGNNKIVDDLTPKERGMSKKMWRDKVVSTSDKLGGYNIDYDIKKSRLTVAGEFQFGNWALAYKDVIRLLNANVNPGIDFYIYITATGKLQDSLSSNTVNFDRINKIFQENAALIPVPTWVIGLDIQ